LRVSPPGTTEKRRTKREEPKAKNDKEKKKKLKNKKDRRSKKAEEQQKLKNNKRKAENQKENSVFDDSVPKDCLSVSNRKNVANRKKGCLRDCKKLFLGLSPPRTDKYHKRPA
jgi:hypothetical protein